MRLEQTGQGWLVHTPAKLNLFLEVLGKRADGYHELETVMLSVGIYDSLHFAPAADEQTTLHCRWARHLQHKLPPAAIPDQTDNLVWKAAQLLRSATGTKTGVRIDMIKRIPLQAGMGGGSSDAAATLVALNRLWNLHLSSSELHALAAKLGSDLNFFIDSPLAAVCRGRGELVEPVSAPSGLWITIFKPEFGLSTAEVFKNFRPQLSPRTSRPLVDALQSGQPARIAKSQFNALWQPALAVEPKLGPLINDLKVLGAREPLMTGSGSACFSFSPNRSAALRLARQIQARRHGTVMVVQSKI